MEKEKEEEEEIKETHTQKKQKWRAERSISREANRYLTLGSSRRIFPAILFVVSSVSSSFLFFFFHRPFTARQTGQLHICKKLKYVVKRLREITHQFVLICILRGLIYIAHSPFSGCGDNRSCYHYDSLVMLRPKRTEASKEEEEDEEDDEEDDEEEEAAATAVED